MKGSTVALLGGAALLLVKNRSGLSGAVDRERFVRCISSRAQRYASLILTTADRYKLSPWVVYAIPEFETGWGELLTPPGPGGTCDFIKRDAAKWGSQLPSDGLGWGRGLGSLDYGKPGSARRAWMETGRWKDPAQNIDTCFKETIAPVVPLLAPLALVPDLALRAAICAYNAGPAAVVKAVKAGKDPDVVTYDGKYSQHVMLRIDKALNAYAREA